MNERIEQLAFKVMDEPVDLERTHLKIDVVRFAELIVAECKKINSELLGHNTLTDLHNMYKEHFGVEE